jgi:hypothetical protein
MATVVAGLFIWGCAWSTDTSIVTFQDPKRVSVFQLREDGTSIEIIPQGVRSDVIVYRESGGIFGSERADRLQRTADGSLRFTWGSPTRVLIDASGHMARQPWTVGVFFNESSRTFEQVFIPFVETVNVDPHRDADVRGYLLTRWSNIAEIRSRRGPDRRMVGTWACAILVLGGSLAAGIGGWLVSTGATARDGRTSAVPEVTAGLLLGGLGLTLDAWALWHRFGPNRETTVYP